ncbi:hypothetical protein DMENIID0001_148570 [Sergentomyia squamirostris]
MAFDIKQEKIDIEDVLVNYPVKEENDSETFSVDIKNAPRDSDIVKFEITEVDLEELGRKTESSPKDVFKCDLCIKSFESQKGLRVHKKRHFAASGRFVCLLCPQKEFQTMRGLVRHSNGFVHPHDGALFKCKVCKKSLSSKYAVVNHSSVCGKFKCNVCDKGFTSKALMESHRKKLHYGNDMEKLLKAKQKPLICYYCGKNFSEQTLLDEHVNEHRSKGKNYCTKCNKSFQYITQFERHPCRNTAGMYTCNYCSWGFADDESLQIHRTFHRDAPPICQYCHKHFTAWKYLKIHILHFHRDTMKVLNEQSLENLPEPTEPELGELGVYDSD